jgi:hypothetical protein
VAGSTWTQHIPGPVVDIEIFGDSRAVDNMLRSIYNAFSDELIATEFLAETVDPLLRSSIEERFAAEGDAASGPWAPLADATVAIRESQGFPGAHPINVRTGAMKRHLVDDPPRVSVHSLGATMWSPGTPGSPDMQKKMTTAQTGGPRTPARPVLLVGPDDLETMMVALAGYLGKHVAAGGATVNWL